MESIEALLFPSVIPLIPYAIMRAEFHLMQLKVLFSVLILTFTVCFYDAGFIGLKTIQPEQY